MALYIWEGKNRKGETRKGEMEASSEDVVRANLIRQKITPEKVRPKPKDLFEDIAIFQPGVTEQDIINHG